MASFGRRLRKTSFVPRRWLRSVAETLVDGEGNASSQPRLGIRPLPPQALSYPPAELPTDATTERSVYAPPEAPIPLEAIRPDFRATALGKVFEQLGVDDGVFERICERNPRAFHLTQEETSQWIRTFREMLSPTDRELRRVLAHSPRLLSISTAHIENILSFLTEKLRIEDRADLKDIVLEHPEVLHVLRFAPRFGKSAALLFERFKIMPLALQKMVLRHPHFLTRVDERFLLNLAGMFESLIGMSTQQVGKLLMDTPRLLSHTLFGLQERVSFLIHYNIPKPQICDILLRCPSLLDRKYTAELSHVASFLEATLGADQTSVRKIIIYEPSVLKMDTERDIMANLSALKNLGFSQKEITVMLVRCPAVLTLKLYDASIRRKMQFLKEVLHKERQTLVTYPHYLAHSWTEVLLPRVAFLQHLGHPDYEDWPLMKLFGDSDSEFCTRHVRTVPEKYEHFLKTWTQTPLGKAWAPELEE